MKKLIAALCLIPSVAFGQAAVRQSGTVNSGDMPKWTQSQILQSAGGLLGDPTGKGTNPFSVTDNLGIGLQFNSAPTTGSYSSLGFGHDGSGNGVINYVGSGTLTLNINGNVTTLPGSASCIGCGTMSGQNANSVAITGGNINNTVIGGSTPANGAFAHLQIQGPQGTFGPYFVGGNQTGTTGNPWQGWMLERLPGQCANDGGGLFPSANTNALMCISEQGAHSSDPTGASSFNSPRWTVLLDMKTTDSVNQTVTLGCINLSYNAGAKYQCMNIIIGNNNNLVTAALGAGIEFDFQGVGPNTFLEGIEFQAFNGITVNVGGRFTGNGTGAFIDGWDFSGGQFNNSAILIGNYNGTNKQQIVLKGTGSNPAIIRMDNSNQLNILNTNSTLTAFGNGAQYQMVFNNPNNNYVQVNPAGNGSSPALVAAGVSDSNINLIIQGKGSGAVVTNSIAQFNSAVILAAASGVAGASQIAIGSTTAAVANCGGAATACWIINVAGTTRYVPYY